MTDQALREQVARLSAGILPTTDGGWVQVPPNSVDYARADRFLPLFAARERAAAEKASDLVHNLGNLSFGGTGCGCNSEFVFDRETRDLFSWAATTVRAQLEGDGA